MSRVKLENLHKSFGEVRAVQNLNLEIQEGEFFSLLGPSGCGKTTTLRMIAGFELPTSGRIFFDEKEVTFVKPNHRNTGMVFQNFALFPHMTVFENVAFGLRARKVNKNEIKVRVQKSLDMVELANYGLRKVTELSGGQQQRVALARAIVIEPDILLLDEPLSNLDAKLREETREEIKSLQQRLQITTIYVTHDQQEALSLSDRIAVLKDGICQQVGTPQEIYKQPNNAFVASFVGNANTFSGVVTKSEKKYSLVEILPDWIIRIDGSVNGETSQGSEIVLGFRPENVSLNNQKQDETNFQGVIEKIKFTGASVEYELAVGENKIRAKNFEAKEQLHHVGDNVWLDIKPSDIFLFP